MVRAALLLRHLALVRALAFIACAAVTVVRGLRRPAAAALDFTRALLRACARLLSRAVW